MWNCHAIIMMRRTLHLTNCTYIFQYFIAQPPCFMKHFRYNVGCIIGIECHQLSFEPFREVGIFFQYQIPHHVSSVNSRSDTRNSNCHIYSWQALVTYGASDIYLSASRSHDSIKGQLSVIISHTDIRHPKT